MLFKAFIHRKQVCDYATNRIIDYENLIFTQENNDLVFMYDVVVCVLS